VLAWRKGRLNRDQFFEKLAEMEATDELSGRR